MVAIESPCIRRCCLDDHDVCLGCFRTLHDITQWTYLSDGEKQSVVECANARKKAHEEKYGGER